MRKGSGCDAEGRHKLYKSSTINVTLLRGPLLSRLTSRLFHVSSAEEVTLIRFYGFVILCPLTGI